MDEINGINNNSMPNDEALNKNEASEKSVEKEDNGFVFSEDGSYHGVGVNSSEEKEASKPDFTNANTQNNGFNSQNQYTPYQGQGYGANTQPNNPYGSYNQYANNAYGSPSQNQYANNKSNYDFSDQQHSYAYSNETQKKPKKSGKGAKIFVAVICLLCVFLVVALIAVCLGSQAFTFNKSPKSEEITENEVVSVEVEEFQTNASPSTDISANTQGALTPKAIFNKVCQSSVGIMVYDKSKSLTSEGTGVLYQESKDGKYTYIVTCAHVINGASGYILVQLYNGDEYKAEVVGADARTDIGVLRIEKSGLKLAEIGDSAKVAVGDYVYALGNPGGVEFANSFTNGMVSALDRPVSSSSTGYVTECIQHTAAINPGNSGGALVNSFGQVIGINSMKIVDTDYEGMGFSVPSSVFVKIVNELTAHGYVSNRPKLGITFVAASKYSEYGMFVAIKGLPSGSIVIYDIAKDSALNGTEAQKGDMIVAVNGKPLDDASYLSELVENSNVGDTLTLSLVRIHDDYSYDEFDVTATLIEDRGTVEVEEETTMPSGYSGGYDSYEDFFNNYFNEFFNDRFGGGFAP